VSKTCLIDLQKQPCLLRVGHKLEVVNPLEPDFTQPGTVVQVAGHLVKVFLDAGDRKNPRDMLWMEWDSLDLYPCGYSEFVGQPFQVYLKVSAV